MIFKHSVYKDGYFFYDFEDGKLFIKDMTNGICKSYKIKVDPTEEFIYKIQKTQIKCDGGWDGLLKHLSREGEDFEYLPYYFFRKYLYGLEGA